jgi:uncharacterized protein YceK
MNPVSLVRRSLVLPTLLAVAVLSGCASQMTHQEMTPVPVKVATQHSQSVTVTAMSIPGSDLVGTMVTVPELQAAVADALAASKAFADVKGKGGDYQLTVQIFNVNHPSFGMSFTSKVEAGWTLKRADTGAVVWQEAIKSEHTTGAGEAFAGVERLKMSIAGAIRNNITTGVAHIGAVKL